MNFNHSIFIIALFYGLIACKQSAKDSEQKISEKIKPDPIFQLVSPETSGLKFVNVNKELNEINIIRYENYYNGCGVAAGDINNDGLVDLYFVSGIGENKLFLNKGNLTFEDITQQAGVKAEIGLKTGVNFIDINADGYLDIYICRSAFDDPDLRRNLLYINNGDLTFTEKAKAYGIDDPSYSTQAYFADIDLDNDLDMYLLNHPVRTSDIKIKRRLNEKGETIAIRDTDRHYISDMLYINTGKNKFTPAGPKSGISNKAFGLSVSVHDFNNDNYPDFYVCNDYFTPDYVLINQKNNTFSEEYDNYFEHGSQSCMGSYLFDANNDLEFDLFTLDMQPESNHRQKILVDDQNYDRFHELLQFDYKAQFSNNAFQLNNGNGTYSDIAYLTNMASTDWSWAVLAGDFDNDLHEDIYITNGIKRNLTDKDYIKFRRDSLKKANASTSEVVFDDWEKIVTQTKLKNYVYRNEGNLTFTDYSHIWESGPPSFSNGAIYSDLDNDGDLDIVTNNMNDNAFLLENISNKKFSHNYIKFKLEGVGQNNLGIGATLTLYINDTTVRTRYNNLTRGFLSSLDPSIHFGLGTYNSISHLEVKWPDGIRKIYKQLKPNAQNTILYNQGEAITHSIKKENPYIKNITNECKLLAKHTENYFIDFKREPLLHLEYSSEGPAIAVGDINKDGEDDVFLGGAHSFSDQLFTQHNGIFKHNIVKSLLVDSTAESIDATFIDIDNDSDLDLYVVSGGYQFPAQDRMYQDRCYINDGSGNLSAAGGSIPSETENGSSVLAFDADNDKDMDLFVGGSVTPDKYPFCDKSLLLLNEKGKFVNTASTALPNTGILGIVKDAISFDINKDGLMDLIVTGEWMPITILINKGNTFSDQTKSYGLEKTNGWWQSLHLVDINNDGNLDFVAGNLGYNTHFKSSIEQPTCIYARDFDKNNTMDAILCTYYNDGKSYPVVYRDRLLDQITTLRKKYLRYHQYANQTVYDIFGKEEVEKATVFNAYNMATSVFINRGTTFEYKALPMEAQISMVKGIVDIDLNNDGYSDLLLTGNFYDTDIEWGRYDASIGCTLMNNKDGSFTFVPVSKSGFFTPGNTRTISKINLKNKQTGFLVGKNDGPIQVFSIK